MSSANGSEKNRVFLLCGLGLIWLNTCLHFPWRNRGSWSSKVQVGPRSLPSHNVDVGADWVWLSDAVVILIRMDGTWTTDDI